ncbi:MAG TPA: nuclease-related domain-containing protein [Candidatus Elarobacter sp.]|nr:nuclease-related domain-containing protein [Candidatus Elarobacter sp.]
MPIVLKRLRKAIREISWPKLLRCLEDSLSNEDVGTLCSELVGSDEIILKHDQERRDLRDELLNELAAYIGKAVGEQAAEQVRAIAVVLATIDEGYQQILDRVDATILSDVSPIERVSAALQSAAKAYDDFAREASNEIRESDPYSPMFGMLRYDGEGALYSPDTAIDVIAMAAMSSILMQAHISGWFTDSGVVNIPLCEASERALKRASNDRYYALCWNRWEDLETHLRYEGGRIARISAAAVTNLPVEYQSADEVIFYQPNEADALWALLLSVARERLRRRIKSDHFVLKHQTNIEQKIGHWSKTTRLPQVEFLSFEEAYASVSLSEILSFDIDLDQARYGALRIVEWLRIFAYLREIARESHQKQGAAGLLQELDVEQLIQELVQRGLDVAKARDGVSSLLLSRKSRDIFDAPLIQLSSGKALLFGPAVVEMNISAVVLSVIHSHGSLDKKGPAFEQALRELLASQGDAQVDNWTFRRNREVFEYDAIMVWGEYVFIFECKNRLLPPNDAKLERQFRDAVDDDLTQIRRLCAGLERHRDAFAARFGCELDQKIVVPCIVYQSPFQRPPTEDGVHFVDYGMLSRFFESRFMRIVKPYRVKETTVLHRLHFGEPQWAGNHPVAADLRRAIGSARQVASAVAAVGVRPIWFELSEGLIAARPVFGSMAVSLDEEIELMGDSPEAVRADMAKMDEFIEKLNAGEDPGLPDLKFLFSDDEDQ